ncbi:MAG TPA: winged helix-turn-helix transcriptional regulator [Gammaproteobacteria bacterium]
MNASASLIARFTQWEALDFDAGRCPVRDVLVTRHVFPTKPPSVAYRLSPLGTSLLKPLAELIGWAERNHEAIQHTRALFDGASP